MQTIKTEDRGIRLLYPDSGQLNIDRDAEALLSVPSLDGLKIYVNGELASVGDHPTRNFTVVRSSKKQVGLRKKGGWDFGDVFIQASIGHNRSIEQRFFVSGSSIPDRRRPTPDMYRKSEYVFQTPEGELEVDFDVSDDIFFKWLGDGWFIISCFDGYFTFNASDGYSKKYFMDCSSPFISKSGLISMRLTSRSTAHSHVNYRAVGLDQYIPTMRLDEHFDDFIFTDWDEHYWISRGNVVIRHDVEPFSGKSMDMLWTREDLEDFESVVPTKKSHCLVNNRFVINTRFPEIYPWSR